MQKPLTPYFWINVNDELPVCGLIEYTNLNPPDAFQGQTLVYSPLYVPASHPRYRTPEDEVLEETLESIARIGLKRPITVTRRADTNPVEYDLVCGQGRLEAFIELKQDAIPGLTIPIWFVPDVTTEEMRTRTGNPEFRYEIACAQLCGLGHYRMQGFVTVLSPEEFQKWVDDEEAKLQEQSETDDIWGM